MRRFLERFSCGSSRIPNDRRADERVDPRVAGLSLRGGENKDGGRPPAGAVTDLGVRPAVRSAGLHRNVNPLISRGPWGIATATEPASLLTKQPEV